MSNRHDIIQQRLREQQCAKNNGHIRIDSPKCDVCGKVAR